MKHHVVEVVIYSMIGIGLAAIMAGLSIPGISAMFVGIGAVVFKNQYYPRLTSTGGEGAQDSEYCMLCRRACKPHCITPGEEGAQDSEYCALCHRACASHC